MTRKRVAELQGGLKTTRTQVKWVEPANFHFTLRFLGEVPDEEVEEVAQAAEGTWGMRGPSRVALRGAGCFPNVRRPRVIWVGVSEGGERLQELHEALSERLQSALGIEPEGRPFSPHLTIGRVKAPPADTALAQAIGQLSEAEAGAFPLDRFVLYQSVLRRSGPVYRVLRAYGAGDEA